MMTCPPLRLSLFLSHPLHPARPRLCRLDQHVQLDDDHATWTEGRLFTVSTRTCVCPSASLLGLACICPPHPLPAVNVHPCHRVLGNGPSFAWAGDSNTYTVLESKLKFKSRAYKNFKESGGAGMKGGRSCSINGLHGGPMLGVYRGKGFVEFGVWENGEIVRRIDANAKNIYWSGTGTQAI